MNADANEQGWPFDDIEVWPNDTVVGLGPAPTVSGTDSDPRPGLTDRQTEIVAAIHELTVAHGRPPTIRELGKVVGIRSPNGVVCHLDPLIRKGYLQQRGDTKARGLILLPAPARWTGEPAPWKRARRPASCPY